MQTSWYRTLYFQVLIAIALGAALGHFSPEWGEKMKPLGDGFIRLVTMMIAPIIFCTIVTGVAGAGSLKQAGRVGIKALVYFEAVTTLALVIGLVIVNTWQPGAGMHVDAVTLDTAALHAKLGENTAATMPEFFLHLIPVTLLGAFTGGELLQVVLASLLFAAALAGAGDKAKPVTHFIENISHVLFGMIGLVMKVAPVGAFGAMAFTIGKYGVGALGSLAQLMLCFYATCLIFIFAVLGSILWICCRISILRFLIYIKEELLIVLGTSSSESVLPRIIDKLAHLGCDRAIVGITIPTGYSFNLDGTSIYLTMAAIFIAQATGVPLTLWQELALLGTLLLTSKGAAGVTGSGFVTLAATLSATGSIPVAGLALILGVDRFMSEARALTNLVGNGVATLVIARWENAFDVQQAHTVLIEKKNPPLETVV